MIGSRISRRNLFVSAFGVASLQMLNTKAHASNNLIDRKALVSRHNPNLTKPDPSSPLMLGNSSIGFTADITGLQTFRDEYSAIAPLLTEAQWAWHSHPNPNNYTVKDTQIPIDVNGIERKYGYYKDWAEASKNPAIAYIRENPHRFSLAKLSFDILNKNGNSISFSDLTDTKQVLDLWTGTLKSQFKINNKLVKVETRVLPNQDTIMVEVESELIRQQNLNINIDFPGVSKTLNPDPSDFKNQENHKTIETSRSANLVRIKRQIDDTIFQSAIGIHTAADILKIDANKYSVKPKNNTNKLIIMVQFSKESGPALPSPNKAKRDCEAYWKDYWSNGGMVDFNGSTDTRAPELERRIILSQYLMAINAAGIFPPQEEGLFSNSWNGKSHLEMHPWHSAHFALWGRSHLLEKSLAWYLSFLPKAKVRAKEQGLKGAWWPKMIGPDGVDSPSKVSPFIMWQQPHPIYMSELIWRAKKQVATLKTYETLVEASAELLASFMVFDKKTGYYKLGPPIIPVQENFDPLITSNPLFEVAYFRWGIETAQKWRERLGKKRRIDWDEILAKWPELPQKDGLYLPTGSQPDFWDKAAGAVCRADAINETCQNKDHPSFLMAYGWINSKEIDPKIMRATLERIKSDWDLRQTWGWDYPMIAMTAARLNAPEEAIDWLFYPAKNNQFGLSGMTPRVHLDAHAAAFVPNAKKDAADEKPIGPDGAGYLRAAETYFPSNGGLLLAIALMVGGWDGNKKASPGFAAKGWKIKAEGILPLM